MYKKTTQALKSMVGVVTSFAKLERVLATIIILIPAIMIAGDNGNIRHSVSAYFNMGHGRYNARLFT